MNTSTDCTRCGGPLMHLGAFGDRLHLKCRDCGAMFSIKLSDLYEWGEKKCTH